MTFDEYIAPLNSDLQSVLRSVIRAGVRIAEAVKTTDTGKAGTKNSYGEEQAALDVVANDTVNGELKDCEHVGFVASEELDKPLLLHEGGAYTVCHDPIDGSSLIDVNLSVATIVGVYRAVDLVGRTPREQVAAMFFLYGPRITMMFTAGSGTHEFTLRDGGFFQTKSDVTIADRGKMFAPGNLRAAIERDDYVRLMEFWMREQYTLRYSGGMVPDINQILVKGGGIFTYPPYSDMPDGKLRLLFECGPMAMIVTQAGGSASDGKIPILDKKITDMTQRTPIFAGSKKEVEKAISMLDQGC